jgi:hypothetical protein
MAIDLTLEYTTISVGSRTNTTMNKPTNTADGNFLLAGITIQGTDITITPPSGWTSIVKVTSPYGTVWLEIFYKRASSEPSSWTWTHAASTTAGFVKRITGVVSSGNPEDCTRDTVCINYLTLLTNSSISPVTAGCGICQILGDLYDSSWSSETLTERIDIADIAFCADVQAGSGPTGNKSATSSGSELSIGILIALKPEGEAIATLSGTVTGNIKENDIVAGGKTIILTLDGDTFIPNT